MALQSGNALPEFFLLGDDLRVALLFDSGLPSVLEFFRVKGIEPLGHGLKLAENAARFKVKFRAVQFQQDDICRNRFAVLNVQ